MASRSQSLRDFERRHRIFERRYFRIFNRELNKINREVAKGIEVEGIYFNYSELIDQKDFTKLYETMYLAVSISEAKRESDIIEQRKQARIGGIISFWRGLIRQFIFFRIAHRITGVSQTTKDRVAFLIEQGIDDGKGAVEVAKDIRNDFKFTKNRSLNIARTETVTAMNYGRILARENSPYVEEKTWLPAIDDRTRPSHLALRDVGWVDLEQDFFLQNNDGFLEPALFPGDDRLSAENTCNCRCTLSFRPKRDENGNLIRKDF